MSSRKRKLSTVPETSNGTSSKRAKLLSDLWSSQEERSDRGGPGQAGISSTVYTIKAIIGERESEYLIDWADDPITGEGFQPDWQPKSNVNLAAIDIWESKHPPKPNTKSSKSRWRGRKGRHLKHSRNCTISDTVVENQDRETQHISETPPVRPDERLLQNQNKPQESAKSQSPFANDPNPPETSAQILHRSNSLKRAFCTSSESFTPVSIGLTTPSHHSTPQLEESSRELDTSLAFVTQEDGIIPDSQSLPGSSSYVPTSNTSTSGSATQKSRISVPSNFVSPVLTNIQGRDSAESSSNFEVAASQLSLSSSQRSQSAPPSSSAARLSTPPCGAHLPLLVRTSSDPSPANTFKQDQQSPEHRYPTTRYNRPSKRTADSRFTLLASSKQRPRSPEIQIPGSVTRSSEQSSSADTYRLDHSLVIQTQDPLASPKQGERIIQTPVESWQGGREIANTDQQHCQISSASRPRRSFDRATHIDSTFIIPHTLEESPCRPNSALEAFEISADLTDTDHPSQATTTDDSILSAKDSNSQKAPRVHSEQRKVDKTQAQENLEVRPLGSLSSDLETPVVPFTLDSREPPQPPTFTQISMSGIPSNQEPTSICQQEPLGTKERLKKLREENAAKKEASRIAQGQSNPSSAGASPSRPVERQLSHSSISQASLFSTRGQQQSPLIPVTRALPPLTWAGSAQPISPVGHAFSISNVDGPPRSPFSHTPPASNRAGPQPAFPAGGASPALSRVGAPQSQPPTASTAGVSQVPRLASSAASPSSQSRMQVQSPGLIQSRAGTSTPDIIPNKLAYQVEEEPGRLEVQPALISTELPLPTRSSQSVPHTPATPSRLSTHNEASPSQTVSLEPKNLGNNEFVVPLCMQKRIVQQYVDTIKYYPTSIKESITQKSISEKSIENLNGLLCRLANVSTHIGLEGGGPSSQDSVRSEQEAQYAEVSSEKFKFLSHLFQALKDDDLHVAIVARPGLLHDIIELFLKGKKIHYNRPGTYSKSNLGPGAGKLHVSVIASGEEVQPTHFTRSADVVIALDETFDAKNQTIVDLRKPNSNTSGLKPVLRLIVYSSAEHLDLCLSRTLGPIDRIRKLIHCVWHTQGVIGEIQDHEPSTQDCGEYVALFLRRGGNPILWTLPKIRPIENIPVMDSESSLSDAMSDISVRMGKPHDVAQKYWPNKARATVAIASTNVLSGGKRPFDLDHGDSIETQLKKQKMAKRAHAGKPIEEPRTIGNLENLLKDMQIREQNLVTENSRQEETITSFRNGAERRQGAFEDLRDKWSELHHDKIDLTSEVAKLKKDLEKVRSDRLSLQGERGQLKQDLEAVRQQLINHPNPLIAQDARKDAQIRQLTDDLTTLKKKHDFNTTAHNYLQEQYQEVSVNAARYLEEIEDLQKKIEPLESRLQHEYARRKHERENDARKPLYVEIDALRAEMARQAVSAERVILRKEEEIKELKRGRAGGVQTRGSSAAPRSPKGGSRGVSPAAGLLGSTTAAGGKGPSGLNRPIFPDE